MKKSVIMFLTIICSVSLAQGQWSVYNGNVLPENFTAYDSTFSESQTDGGLDNGVSDLVSVIDNPDDPGHNILYVNSDEDNPGESEMWSFPWNANPDESGVTLAFRSKGLSEGTRPHDIYLGNGQARERLNSRLSGAMKFDKSDAETDDAFIENYDIFEWHTYRVTISTTNQFKLYIDDNPDPVLLSIGGESSDYNGWKFGDGGSDSYNAYYDWFAWRTDGEFPPGEGGEIPVGIEHEIGNTPVGFLLSQNYPNPFNPNTHISFMLEQQRQTSLKVYDANGRLVETLVNETMAPGTHNIEFNGTDLPSGIYFYTVSAGNLTKTKKMVLLK